MTQHNDDKEMESEVPGLVKTFSDGDKSGSSTTTTTSYSSMNSKKIRKKLENRRSILNQVEDGEIRRKENTNKSNQQRNVGKTTAPQDKHIEIRNSSNSATMIATSTPPRTSLASINVKMSPSPIPIQKLNHMTDVSASIRSISRKRERKEAAEQRLKGLFSAAALIRTKSDDVSFHYPSAMDAQADTMSDHSSSRSRTSTNKATRRQLFNEENDSRNHEGENHQKHEKQQECLQAPVNIINDENEIDDENIIRPIPKRITESDVNVIADKLANVNIEKPDDDVGAEVATKDNAMAMHRISDQLNIQVYDNFYMFKL